MGPFVPVHLASLKRAVGDLDQGTAWLRIFVMVNVPLTNGGLYSPNRLEETCFRSPQGRCRTAESSSSHEHPVLTARPAASCTSDALSVNNARNLGSGCVVSEL
jgi:hypothetical protein